MLKGNFIRYQQCILFDNPCWNPNELGIGPVVEQKVLTQILLTVSAEKTCIAGSRIQSDNSVPAAKRRYTSPDFRYNPREFMAKRHRGLQHLGVITAPVDLKIRPASQSGSHMDNQLTRARLRHRHTLQPEVFLAIEHRCCHLSYHSLYLLIPRLFDAPSAHPTILHKGAIFSPTSASDNLSHITNALCLSRELR
jgi:hypothetical protein